MGDILMTLGKSAGTLQKTALILAFCFVISIVLLVGTLVNHFLGVDVIALHLISWGIWFCWQVRFTPTTVHTPPGATTHERYRRAFYWHILPGVSFGVAQMVRPLFYAFTVREIAIPEQNYLSLLGLLVLCTGILLLFLGFRTIGFAAAGFLQEYDDTSQQLVTSGIYGAIRHPLFLGGVVASLGTALFADDTVCLLLGLCNVAILPVYGFIEDRRSKAAIGDEYEVYRSIVPAFVPYIAPFDALMPFAPGHKIEI